MPEVVIRRRLHDVPQRVYHTDLGCSHAPTGETRAVVPLDSLDDVREWRECRVCSGAQQSGTQDWSYQALARDTTPEELFGAGGESA